MALATQERKTLPNHLDYDQLDATLRWGELFINDGKLARYIGAQASKDRPEVELIFQQSDIRLMCCDEEDPIIVRVLGCVAKSENTQVYTGYGSYTHVDLRGAPLARVTVPVLKPRDGKEYTWHWTGERQYSTFQFCRGYWERQDFPRCPECRKYHNPDFTYCESCYRCRKPGGKCK